MLCTALLLGYWTRNEGIGGADEGGEGKGSQSHGSTGEDRLRATQQRKSGRYWCGKDLRWREREESRTVGVLLNSDDEDTTSASYPWSFADADI